MNFENLKLIDTETLIGTDNGTKYDFDRYTFELKQVLSTKEIFVTVSYLEDDKEPIEGDMIAYGDWGDIELEMCLECLKYVQNNNLAVRSIDEFLK